MPKFINNLTLNMDDMIVKLQSSNNLETVLTVVDTHNNQSKSRDISNAQAASIIALAWAGDLSENRVYNGIVKELYLIADNAVQGFNGNLRPIP